MCTPGTRVSPAQCVIWISVPLDSKQKQTEDACQAQDSFLLVYLISFTNTKDLFDLMIW